ncbi:MAG: hypothetical protein QOH64_790, partial [Acidimicrobiaceae bacterium]
MLSTPLTVSGALRAAAHSSGQQEALVDGAMRLSYAELLAAAEEAARALIASGV